MSEDSTASETRAVNVSSDESRSVVASAAAPDKSRPRHTVPPPQSRRAIPTILNAPPGIADEKSFLLSSSSRGKKEDIARTLDPNDLLTSVWNDLLLDDNDYINFSSLGSQRWSSTQANKQATDGATTPDTDDVNCGKRHDINDVNFEVTYQNIVKPRRDVTISTEKERKVNYIKINYEPASANVTSTDTSLLNVTSHIISDTVGNRHCNPITSTTNHEAAVSMEGNESRQALDHGPTVYSMGLKRQSRPLSSAPETRHENMQFRVKVKADESDVNNLSKGRIIPVQNEANISMARPGTVAAGEKGVTYESASNATRARMLAEPAEIEQVRSWHGLSYSFWRG